MMLIVLGNPGNHQFSIEKLPSSNLSSRLEKVRISVHVQLLEARCRDVHFSISYYSAHFSYLQRGFNLKKFLNWRP